MQPDDGPGIGLYGKQGPGLSLGCAGSLSAIDYDILHGAKDPSKTRPNQETTLTAAPLDAIIGEIDPTKNRHETGPEKTEDGKRKMPP